MSNHSKENSIFTQNTNVRIVLSLLIIALITSCGGEESNNDPILVDITDENGVVDSLKFYQEKLNFNFKN